MELRFADIDLESTLIEDTRRVLADELKSLEPRDHVDPGALRITSRDRFLHALNVPILEGRKPCGHLHARGGSWAFLSPLYCYAALALTDGTVVEWTTSRRHPRTTRVFWNLARWCEIHHGASGIYPRRVTCNSGATLAEIRDTYSTWEIVKRIFRLSPWTLTLSASGREVPLYSDFPAAWSYAALPFPEASELSREEQLLYLTLRLLTVVADDFAED